MVQQQNVWLTLVKQLRFRERVTVIHVVRKDVPHTNCNEILQVGKKYTTNKIYRQWLRCRRYSYTRDIMILVPQKSTLDQRTETHFSHSCLVSIVYFINKYIFLLFYTPYNIYITLYNLYKLYYVHQLLFSHDMLGKLFGATGTAKKSTECLHVIRFKNVTNLI